jgi:RNA polymerase sigma factor (sigma-70 family)
MNEDHPIRTVTKIRNNRLQSWRESIGLSPFAAAKLIGISYPHYLDIEALRHYPSEGTALKISAATGISVSYLFPDYFKSIAKTVAINTIPEEIFLPLLSAPKELLMIPAPQNESDKEITKDLLRDSISEALSTLTQREARVLRMRFGFDGDSKTLDEIGESLAISRERVRQLCEKGLRKLRSPGRARLLIKFENPSSDYSIPSLRIGDRVRISTAGLNAGMEPSYTIGTVVNIFPQLNTPIAVQWDIHPSTRRHSYQEGHLFRITDE